MALNHNNNFGRTGMKECSQTLQDEGDCIQLQNYLSQYNNGKEGGANGFALRSRDPKEQLTMIKSKIKPNLDVPDYMSQASGRDSFCVANALGVRPFKVSETPQQQVPSDLTNYLNWVPTKEKLQMSAAPAKGSKAHKLSPLRAGPRSTINEEDKRSTMSKTVIQMRDKLNNSQLGKHNDREISIDGMSISVQQPKPRAFSNLRTLNSYGNNKIETSSLYIKKNHTPGILSPNPHRRHLLDELSWEDRQKVLNMSMAQVNQLKRDDLLRAITLPSGSTLQPKLHQVRRLNSDDSSIDDALKKLARAGDEFSSIKDFARYLIKRFDTDHDGIISFQELCDGLKQYEINLPLKDRVAMMKRLDMNNDGQISDIEMYKALSSIETQLTKETVDQALKKIVAHSEEYANMKEYCKALIKKFDSNNDGQISFQELTDGLKKMKIHLNPREVQSLMNKIDLNKDGEITNDELHRVLASIEKTVFPRFAIQMSVTQAIQKLAAGADTFSSMKEYARYLIKRFDENQDGIISFRELVDGLISMGIHMSIPEMQGMMKRLDINKDGNITEEELLKVLQTAATEVIPQGLLPQIIDQALRKIASGADDYSNMKDYARSLIKRFDKNNDGIISFKELCDGLKTMNIFLSQREREGLMKKLDTNADGTLNEQELAKAFSSINVDHLKQMVKDQAEIALKKIAAGAEEFGNMRDYVKTLIRKFDGNQDGIISFDELVNGVKQLHIHLSLKEKIALMKKLDLNRDGEITADELYRVLSKVDIKFSKVQLAESVDQVLRKIASGADEFKSLKDYVRTVVNKIDFNHDGMISFDELCESLHQFKINLTNQEKQALMKKLDFNRDGEITEEELYRALSTYDQAGTVSPMVSRYNSSTMRSPSLSPDKVSLKQKEKERISVEEILTKVKVVAGKYPSFKHYVSSMMRRYDTDADGFLNFKELSDGLDHDHIKLTKEEKLALMKHLDTDCDGVVSKDEIFEALLLDSRHRRNHHHPRVNVEHLLKRIRQGAEKFKTLDEFVKYLFDKLDTDGSGALSFNELSVGLTNMGIEITDKEKHALMKKLDDDADGEIAYDEFYSGLVEAGKFKQPHELTASQALNIDHALQRIAKGAEQYKCLEDYIVLLFRKFDINKDGQISFKELREGLRSVNVHLSDNEIHALFHFLDADRDNEITQEELYNALLTKEKYYKSPNIRQAKINVDQVILLIKKGVEKYSNLEEYVQALMDRFDINRDGLITFDELSEGLKSIEVRISEKEKLALMKEIDKDRDNAISKQELFNALSAVNASSSKVPAGSRSPLRGFNGQALSGIDLILSKIKKAVAHYKSQQEQIIGLLRIFDLDNDGLISYLELVDGVKSLGIQAKKTDMIDLMNQIDTDKDGFITQMELYQALDLRPQHSEYQGTFVSVDQVLVKLKKGAEKYHNIKEYVDVLYQMFATAGSSYMSFQELMNCLKTFNFNLQHVEKIALMKKMDENGDNQISKEEFYNALMAAGTVSSVRQSPKAAATQPIFDNEDMRADQAILKIKSGGNKFKSMADYCAYLFKKLDTNKDGAISSVELAEGLREMGIKMFKGEISAVMRRLDEDRDGLVSYDELLRGLTF